MSTLRAHIFEMAIKDGIDRAIEVAQRWHDALSEVSDAMGTDISGGSHALKERAKEIQAAMDRLQELK